MKAQVNEIKITYKGHFIYENWDKNTIEVHETFKVLLLNNANKVKGIVELSKGGITGTLVDLRLLLAVIIKSSTLAEL